MQLFYSNPNRSFYVREITRKIDEQINSVRRELSNLLAIGIITSDTTNNKLYYEVNQKFKYYAPLKEIFGGGLSSATTVSAEESEATDPNDLRVVGNVELAIYTGQFTRDESTGVDFLVVGEINPNALQKYVDDLEKKEGKSIRYAVMNLQDFMYRQQIRDRFVSAIKQSKKQVIVDKQGIFTDKPKPAADDSGDNQAKSKPAESIKTKATKPIKQIKKGK